MTFVLREDCEWQGSGKENRKRERLHRASSPPGLLRNYFHFTPLTSQQFGPPFVELLAFIGPGNYLCWKVRSCARGNLLCSPAPSLASCDPAAVEQLQLSRSSWKKSQRKRVLCPRFADRA